MSNQHLPYIKDKSVFKAVSFARALRKNMGTGLAVHKAANYYGVKQHLVAKYLGELGANVKEAKNNF